MIFGQTFHPVRHNLQWTPQFADKLNRMEFIGKITQAKVCVSANDTCVFAVGALIIQARFYPQCSATPLHPSIPKNESQRPSHGPVYRQ